MSRFRLQSTPAQERVLLEHCGHARFVWNLAVEQHAHWRTGRRAAPGFVAQCRQLTEARAANAWLAAGSVTVQQQALKDFTQAMANFVRRTHRRPAWRRRGRGEGFRIVAVKPGDVRRISRKVGEVKVPKVGWVRFRWSRAVADGVKSYRVTRDGARRWHIAFNVLPTPIPPPGAGAVVGVDRGVVVSAALSTGELLSAPTLRGTEKARLLRLQRKLARAQRGSNRRGKVKTAIARLRARETDRRKDWVEKISTRLAREFDVIAFEDLKISKMTRSARGTLDVPGRGVRQKAGLNRGILANGWGLLVTRLEHKAPGRVVKVDPRFTSQRCSACGVVDREARESQAAFRCRSCGFAANADVNAALNIRFAAGHAVAARGGPPLGEPMNREPQRDLLLVR
ncbi:RNA-guided endonuclease InsQ/TnpB family protein [Actinokineospora xionganensis]|uniref:Transposase n=1 Tax=Actinokineospora xionganensis TaxID=2684470 RepID=A0ABR7LBM1_9PSEU|nr:RNA-guided endonuclease TnpB family protein [Actinokineospora xionganensis]MBC6450106.1 transposase [Actinokineospora xionganensis]